MEQMVKYLHLMTKQTITSGILFIAFLVAILLSLTFVMAESRNSRQFQLFSAKEKPACDFKEAASSNIEEAKPVAESKEERATRLLMSGKLAFHQKKLALALNHFRSARSCIEENECSLLKGLIADSIGIIYMKLNQVQMAVVNLKEALQTGSETNSSYLLSKAYMHLGQLYENNCKISEAEKFYRQSISFSIEGYSGFSEMIDSFSLQDEPLPFDKLINLLINDNRFEESFYYADMAKEYKLAGNAGNIKQLNNICTIRDIRFVLGENDCIIEYYLIGESLIIFFLDNGEFSTTVIPFDKNISLFPQSLTNKIKKNLIIIPQSEQFFYPFLSAKDSLGEQLIKNHKISFAPSISSWFYKKDNNIAQNNIFLIIAPDNQAQNSAPSSIKEIDSIFPLLSPRIRERDKNATVERAWKTMPVSEYIHFSAPFVPDNLDINFSGLLLNDKILTSYSFYDTNISADLITLSITNSMKSDDDIINLAGFLRALLYSGAESIILNTKDTDEETRIFVYSEIYKRIKAGFTPEESLQQALLKSREYFQGKDPADCFIIVGKRRNNSTQ